MQHVVENLDNVATDFLSADIVAHRVCGGVNDANIPATSKRRLEEVRHFDELPIQRQGVGADPGVAREVWKWHAPTHHQVHVVAKDVRHREAHAQRVRGDIEGIVIDRARVRHNA